MPRTKAKLTRRQYPIITKLAKRGVQETKIAKALGICHST
jgi:DNA-binding NarL/FixJ family response regulator